MSKRSHGEGSIRKRPDGTYEARLMVDGTRQSVYGQTRSEVVDKLDDMRARAAAGAPLLDARVTYGDWLDHWIETCLPLGRKRTTQETYRRHIRNHIRPALGDHRLDRLRPSHVRGLLRQLEQDGKGDQLRRSVYSIVSVSLGDAIDDGLLQSSPIDKVRRPEVEQKDPRWWKPDEVARLLDAAEGDRRWPLLLLVSRTALRRGEALALRWEHLDLDGPQERIRVRGTLSRITGEGLVVTSPKSKRSRRTLRIDQVAAQAMIEHRTSQKRERLAAGAAWQDTGHVFTTELGTPDDPRNVSKWFERLVDEVGLDGSLHTLRHSTASTLVASGVPLRIVAEILGHSSTRLTDEQYSHVAPDLLGDALQRAADAVDRHRR